MTAIALDPKSTALILIDLQNGIVAMKTAPHTTAEVMARAAELASALRAAGGTVIYVHVEMNDMLQRTVDAPMRNPEDPPLPAAASQLAAGNGYQQGGLLVTKRSWGAFYGTDLEQQLRRRSIRTIIMAGVATNIGVESTAREAFDRGYELVFAEDAMSTIAAEAQTFALQMIFPRMGRVRATAEIVQALTS